MTIFDVSTPTADKWLPVAACVVVSAVLMVLQSWVASASARSALNKIPLIGSELGSDEKRRQAFLQQARKVYGEGYERFKKGVFRIVTPENSKTIVVSTSFLPELRRVPDHILSRDVAIGDTLHSKYTESRGADKTMPWVIKARLNPALPRINKALSSEIKAAFTSEMPTTISEEDWTAISTHQPLLRIIARASGRIFVGEELCRSEEYLQAAIQYSTEVFTAAQAVSGVSPWLRPFKAPRLAAVQSIRGRRRAAMKFLRPVIEAREKLGETDEERPDDLLQWLIDNPDNVRKEGGKVDIDSLTRVQLALTFAAIHTSTLVSTDVLYCLAVQPDDVIQELRDEIRSVRAANDGELTKSGLQSMKKMDSFIKETMRCYPFAWHAFERRVLRTFTLSNGQVLPAGATVACTTVQTTDDDVFPDASRFDPWRFSKLQESDKEEDGTSGVGRHQMVSVTPTNLPFGYGRHACPGRFFAINEIKMILSEFLTHYEIRNVDGSMERYPNLAYGAVSVPDNSKKLNFRRIPVQG